MCRPSDEEDEVIRGDVLKLDFGKNAFPIAEKGGAAPPSEKKLPPVPGRIPNFTSIPGSAKSPGATDQTKPGKGKTEE